MNRNHLSALEQFQRTARAFAFERTSAPRPVLKPVPTSTPIRLKEAATC